VHALEFPSGKTLWSTKVPATTKVENYFRNSRAAPTSVVDAKSVISFFPTGDVVSLSHDGAVLWSRPLFKEFGTVVNERGTASSLAQTDQFVIALIDHAGPSYLIALDKADGKTVWKTDRGDRVPSWSSPAVAQFGDTQLVICSSADTVDAYDSNTGEMLWQLEGVAGNHTPSATVVGDLIFVGSTEMFGSTADPEQIAGSNRCLQLVREDGKLSYKILWGAQRVNSYYSSPLAFAGFVYYVNKAGILFCVDQKTGQQLFAKRIGNPCWASAIGVTTAAGEKYAYFVMKNGFTLVLRPGNEYDQVARNQLWDREQMVAAAELAAATRKRNAVPPDQAVPKEGPEKVLAGMSESALHQMFSYDDPTAYAVAIANGHILVRTGQHLYCVSGSQ
jgi:outer membrane protein assembly factor BamB